jgi:hypothetical protein
MKERCSFLKKRTKKRLLAFDHAVFTGVDPDLQKFFAPLRAAITEWPQPRGLNRAAQTWFKKAAIFL